MQQNITNSEHSLLELHSQMEVLLGDFRDFRDFRLFDP